MSKPLRVFKALTGVHFPDGEGETRIEAGNLIPVEFNRLIPKEWIGEIVEEIK